jgi:hypothetical protein
MIVIIRKKTVNCDNSVRTLFRAFTTNLPKHAVHTCNTIHRTGTYVQDVVIYLQETGRLIWFIGICRRNHMKKLRNLLTTWLKKTLNKTEFLELVLWFKEAWYFSFNMFIVHVIFNFIFLYWCVEHNVKRERRLNAI